MYMCFILDEPSSAFNTSTIVTVVGCTSSEDTCRTLLIANTMTV